MLLVEFWWRNDQRATRCLDLSLGFSRNSSVYLAVNDPNSIADQLAIVRKLPQHERGTYLSQLPDDVASQIRSHLGQDGPNVDPDGKSTSLDDGETWEQSSPGALADRMHPSTFSSPSASAAMPEKIGRYTIIGELGKGGQGSIYRGAHPNLPLELAIKVSHRDFDETAKQAIRGEAAILCELDHPNIAKVRDLDFQDGRPYLVLDLIRGRSMAELLVDQNQSIAKKVAWLQTVARAVDYAHRRGVLHLDLKPQNIVIDENDSPKVIDFGLARMRGAWRDRSQESDGISGTLRYMSPEQATGKSDGITASSDVFALGAILYRLLVGVPPFDGATSSEVLKSVQQCQFDQDALNKVDAPKRFVTACLKAMSQDPGERFASASDFADALGKTKIKTSVSAQFLGCGVTMAVTLSLMLLATFGVAKYMESDPSTNLTVAQADPDRGADDEPARSGVSTDLATDSDHETATRSLGPIRSGGPMPSIGPLPTVALAPSGWGWSSDDSTPADVTPSEYFVSLSGGANAWFKKPTPDQAALKKRLTQFRQGCERLLTMEHKVLSEEDREWLIDKCQGWKNQLDQQIAQIDSRTFAESQTTANNLATEIAETLKARSESV